MDLNKNCDTLMNYKNCVEHNIGKIQKKMEEDKSLILSAINVSLHVKIFKFNLILILILRFLGCIHENLHYWK